MADQVCERKTLNHVLAEILEQVMQGWKREEYGQRSQRQQFGLLWLGAFTFTYPLFMVHSGEKVSKWFSSIQEVIFIYIISIFPCSVIALMPAWLLMSKQKGQTKVRLYLMGFFLPYVVIMLLLPVMEIMKKLGGAP